MKLYYKMEILYNKFSPFVIAYLILIDNMVTNIGFYCCRAEGYLFVPSLFTLVHMYISRKNLLLCRFHRVAVNYCGINTIGFAIKEFTNTKGDLIWLVIDSVIALIAIIIGIYYYRKDGVKC